MEYKDSPRQRVAWADRATLARTGVLFAILSVSDTKRPRLNGRRRVREKFGKDWYYLFEENGMASLDGWDDKDFPRIPLSDPFSPIRGLPPILPPGALVFEGGYLPPDEWEESLKIYYAEMH